MKHPRIGPDVWLAGVDGCRDGWFVALTRFAGRGITAKELRFRLCASFAEVLALPERPAIVAVDMPIGLPHEPKPGGRGCDRAARKLLGPRAASVFSPPTRAALKARSYREAIRRNGAGLSRQVFNLFGKLREVDERMRPARQRIAHEAHPELAFLHLAGRPLRAGKKSRAGRRERERLLRHHFGRQFASARTVRALFTGQRLAADDVLDACALCVSAQRIFRGDGICLPPEPPRDRRGLRMEIWY